jgi:hypothetical protein
MKRFSIEKNTVLFLTKIQGPLNLNFTGWLLDFTQTINMGESLTTISSIKKDNTANYETV